MDAQTPEGLVLGTEQGASTPLAFWTYVDPSRYLQLDDVVHVRSPLPDGQDVDFYGVVDELRAVQEGVRFASDVALASSGVLPAETAVSAHVSVTRVEPEIFVPPRPGEAVRRAHGAERDRALFFDAMTRRLPVGLSRGGEPIYANLDFLDGSEARTSTSPASPASRRRPRTRCSCSTRCSAAACSATRRRTRARSSST